jgi:hypothetical protein
MIASNYNIVDKLLTLRQLILFYCPVYFDWLIIISIIVWSKCKGLIE